MDLADFGLPTSFGSTKESKKRPLDRPHHNKKRTKRSWFGSTSHPPRELTQTGLPFRIGYCVAPMVGASDLAFRLLCRKYGAECVWTEMFPADKFATEEYRAQYFQVNERDRPLVVQFCGHDPAQMTAAALLAQSHCDCVEINLGCPQRPARLNLYGAYLMAKEHWTTVFTMVQSLKDALTIPVACKIRLLSSIDETIEFCRGLESHGCQLITIHGRTLLSDKRKRRRVGPADLNAIKQIKAAVAVPVIANGNVRSFRDVQRNWLETECDGIMSAEAVLANPALFDETQRVRLLRSY
eukprot:c15537_g1_i1.p1 GENE.c15537_g1_i1~~c15537_g1_i1.p1  ORF type:complete len:297 (+),score=40.51 c15537_g1_i1:29-919(+)